MSEGERKGKALAKILRLVVGIDGGARSSSWRVWEHGDSFYVAPREMQGAIKVSLHPPSDAFLDGRWVFGFTKEFLDAGGEMTPSSHPRWVEVNTRPMRVGVTRACTVQVPHAAVNLLDPLPGADKHIWVSPPAQGLTRELVFLLLAAGSEHTSSFAHPGLLGGIDNRRGDRLVVLHREVSLAERPRLSGDLEPQGGPAEYARVRAVFMGVTRDDGSPVLTEVSGEPSSVFRQAVESGEVSALFEVDDDHGIDGGENVERGE